MAKITYDDKNNINTLPSVPDNNKITDENMNEIKNVVNETIISGLGLDTNTFSTSTTYSVGDLVVYDNKIYEFTSSHTGAWTGNDVSLVPILVD
jgi:hypothetical protein